VKNIKKSVAELVGNTPLVELTNYEKKNKLDATILAKLEYFNPSGSIKDRAALAMIEDAEERGLLKEGGTIIEATSGNTGISLATFAAIKNMTFEAYLEPGVTIERTQIFDAFGVKQYDLSAVPGLEKMQEEGLVLEDLLKGMHQIADDHGYYYTEQTKNDVNQQCHYKTTGPEIWRDTDGEVDILVAAAGTAGTIVGTGRYLKEQNPDLKIIGVQPHPESRPEGEHFTGNIIDGILPMARVDENQIPPVILDNLDNGFALDEVIDIHAEDAYATAKELTRTDGLFLGTSAAAIVTAAKQLALRPENKGKNIVAIIPDNGMKYLSTDMYK
jgi:cysteine synthase A